LVILGLQAQQWHSYSEHAEETAECHLCAHASKSQSLLPHATQKIEFSAKFQSFLPLYYAALPNSDIDRPYYSRAPPHLA